MDCCDVKRKFRNFGSDFFYGATDGALEGPVPDMLSDPKVGQSDIRVRVTTRRVRVDPLYPFSLQCSWLKYSFSSDFKVIINCPRLIQTKPDYQIPTILRSNLGISLVNLFGSSLAPSSQYSYSIQAFSTICSSIAAIQFPSSGLSGMTPVSSTY